MEMLRWSCLSARCAGEDKKTAASPLPGIMCVCDVHACIFVPGNVCAVCFCVFLICLFAVTADAFLDPTAKRCTIDDFTRPHLCSMGSPRPSSPSPGRGGETSRSARIRCRSQKPPRRPSGSCCRLCDRILETRGSHTSPALDEGTKQVTIKIIYRRVNFFVFFLIGYWLVAGYRCSSFRLRCTGAHRCRCRSRPCYDNWRVHHSPIPERTRPHLSTHTGECAHYKDISLLVNLEKGDFIYCSNMLFNAAPRQAGGCAPHLPLLVQCTLVSPSR